MAFKDKPQVVRPNMDKKQAEYTERLRHYNEWLMDDTRDSTSTYPGFPGDAKKEKTTIVVEKPEVAPIKSTKGSKNSMKIQNVGMKVQSVQVMKRPKAGTKQALAIEIVQSMGVAKKHDAISEIMAKLSMSKAGATTYFHNARHFIERQSPVNA